MTVAMPLVPTMWDTDDGVQYVLMAIADRPESDTVTWLDRLSQGDVDTFHVALIEADRADLMWMFEAGSAFHVDNESLAVLFESLVDYGQCETVSAQDTEYRENARRWVPTLAERLTGVKWA